MAVEKEDMFKLVDEDGKVSVTIDGKTANYQAGGSGHDGDIMLLDAEGRKTIHLNAFDGAVLLGGPGQDGDIKLKNVKDQQTIHLNGRSGAIHLGGLDTDGEVFIKNAEGSEVIILDGNAGTIKVDGKNVATADFVFEADYALQPIQEVASFINENKHLPNVPSGQEIKENGLDLNSFSMQLLRKVEELTLYVIDQNKKIEAQQAQIETLLADKK